MRASGSKSSTSAWFRELRPSTSSSASGRVVRTRPTERGSGGARSASTKLGVLSAEETARANAAWRWFKTLTLREREAAMSATEAAWVATVLAMHRTKGSSSGNFAVQPQTQRHQSGAAKFEFVASDLTADASLRLERGVRLDGNGETLFLDRALIADVSTLRTLLESLSGGRFLAAAAPMQVKAKAKAAPAKRSGSGGAPAVTITKWLSALSHYSLGAYVASKLELAVQRAFMSDQAAAAAAGGSAAEERRLLLRPRPHHSQLDVHHSLDAFWRALRFEQREECASCDAFGRVATAIGCTVEDALRDDTCAMRVMAMTLDDAAAPIAVDMRRVVERLQSAHAERSAADLVAGEEVFSAKNATSALKKKKKKKNKKQKKRLVSREPEPEVELEVELEPESEAELASELAAETTLLRTTAAETADPLNWQTVSRKAEAQPKKPARRRREKQGSKAAAASAPRGRKSDPERAPRSTGSANSKHAAPLSAPDAPSQSRSTSPVLSDGSGSGSGAAAEDRGGAAARCWASVVRGATAAASQKNDSPASLPVTRRAVASASSSVELAGVQQQIAAAAGSSEGAAAWTAVADARRQSKLATVAADQVAPDALNLKQLQQFDDEIRSFYRYCLSVATERTPSRVKAVARIRAVVHELFGLSRDERERESETVAGAAAEATAAAATFAAAAPLSRTKATAVVAEGGSVVTAAAAAATATATATAEDNSVGDYMLAVLSGEESDSESTAAAAIAAVATATAAAAAAVATRRDLVFEFGSAATTMALPTSDVDLFVRPPHSDAVAPHLYDINRLAAALRDEAWITSIQCIDTAIVPVLKLVSPCVRASDGGEATGGNLKLDISMWRENHLGHSTLQLVLQLSNTWQPLPAMMVVLKQLLTEHGLSNPSTGGLASYGLLLMVVRFLQVYQTRRHRAQYLGISYTSLGHLILEFLLMYSPAPIGSFDPSKTGLRIDEPEIDEPEMWKGSFVPRRTANSSKKNQRRSGPWTHDPLLLIDPLNDTSNNVGKSCYRINSMLRVFAQAYERLDGVLRRATVTPTETPQPIEALVGNTPVALGSAAPRTVLSHIIALADTALGDGSAGGGEGGATTTSSVEKARASVQNALRYAQEGHRSEQQRRHDGEYASQEEEEK